MDAAEFVRKTTSRERGLEEKITIAEGILEDLGVSSESEGKIEGNGSMSHKINDLRNYWTGMFKP